MPKMHTVVILHFLSELNKMYTYLLLMLHTFAASPAVMFCFFCHSTFVVVQFGLLCGLCVGLMALIATATCQAGFFCNNRK